MTDREKAIELAKEWNKSNPEQPQLKFVAMDDNGVWCGYRSKPERSAYIWYLESVVFFHHSIYYSNVNWEDTLTEVTE